MIIVNRWNDHWKQDIDSIVQFFPAVTNDFLFPPRFFASAITSSLTAYRSALHSLTHSLRRAAAAGEERAEVRREARRTEGRDETKAAGCAHSPSHPSLRFTTFGHDRRMKRAESDRGKSFLGGRRPGSRPKDRIFIQGSSFPSPLPSSRRDGWMKCNVMSPDRSGY